MIQTEAEVSETTALLNGSPQSSSLSHEVDVSVIQNVNTASEDDSGQLLSNEDIQVEGDEQKKQVTGFQFWQISRRKKLTLALLALANFFSGCGFSLLAPFFPQEAEKKGVSNTVTGLIFSSFELTVFLTSPIFGLYLTQIGPKFLFMSGIFVDGVCTVLFGLLAKCPPDLSFVIVCFACRCVGAVGCAAYVTSSFAIISYEFPQHIATVFGLLETANGIGLMAGPGLGGVLYETGGFGLPFFIIGAATLLSGVMIFKLLPDPEDVNHERKASVVSLLQSPLVLVTAVTIVAAGMGISFLDPTFSKHLEKLDLSTSVIGLIFVIGPALYGMATPVFGYFSDTKNIQSPLLIIGNGVAGLGFLIIGPSPYLTFLPFKLWVVILGIILLELCIGGAIVPTMKLLVIGAGEIGFEDNLDTYGIVSGLFNSVICLGSFLGPMVGGVLVQHLGFRYSVTVMAGLYFFVMLVTALFFILRRLKQRSRHRGYEIIPDGNAS